MKLLIDVRSMGRAPSGIGIYAYNFIKELHQYMDLQMVLVSDVAESDQIRELQKLERVTFCLYGKAVSKTIVVIDYYRFVQRVINETRPSIFWEVNNLIPIRLHNPGGKIVVTIHDVFPLSMPECYGPIYPLYFRFGLRNTFSQTDAILYDSEDARKATERYFPNARNIQSIISYIVVNTEHSTANADDNYFLYIGNLEKRKGTDLLLQAYCAYRLAGGDRKLVLSGKFRDPDIETLYRTVRQKVDGIQYLGYVDEEKKELLLSRCSCFVFPSRAEGFGIPAMEALIHGKPIILSDLPIFDELLGKAQGRVNLEGDAAENLKQAMLDETRWYRCSSDQIADKFGTNSLGQRVHDFFLELE